MKKAGGKCFAYTADLTDMADCDRLVQAGAGSDHGHVDVLVNNAGRSIRRSIELSYDRFHDFERTMQLNYFGSLRLIMGFMPSMTHRRRGHIINISSIGVLANSPRFSAYVASKAALDAFSRCAQGELSGKGITFTTINMPLVKTPMIAPTKMYESVPTLTPEEAADLVVKGDHRAPEPDRDATGHLRFRDQRGGAEGLRSDHEHRVRAVPGFGRGQGRQEGAARGDATQQRADRLRGTDAGRALVAARAAVREIENAAPGAAFSFSHAPESDLDSIRRALQEARWPGRSGRGLQLQA